MVKLISLQTELNIIRPLIYFVQKKIKQTNLTIYPENTNDI